MKTTRITVDLAPRLYERLGKVEELTGAASKAEVIRRALSLYAFLLKQAERGAEVQVVERDGKLTIIAADLALTPLPSDPTSYRARPLRAGRR